MHALVARGIMPIQMSYSGRNFDIVTGIDGDCRRAAREARIRRPPAGLVWNVLGTRAAGERRDGRDCVHPDVQAFGDDHVVTFVTYTPFVWLPTVMVVAALAGHLVIFRALRRL